MKTMFKVGDKVWDGFFFKGLEGEVVGIDNQSSCPISVKWSGGVGEDYTFEGALMFNRAPTLSLVPYEFKIPEQPKRFNIGETGIFWDKTGGVVVFGELEDIDDSWIPFKIREGNWYKNFKPMLKEEFNKIFE